MLQSDSGTDIYSGAGKGGPDLLGAAWPGDAQPIKPIAVARLRHTRLQLTVRLVGVPYGLWLLCKWPVEHKPLAINSEGNDLCLCVCVCVRVREAHPLSLLSISTAALASTFGTLGSSKATFIRTHTHTHPHTTKMQEAQEEHTRPVNS